MSSTRRIVKSAAIYSGANVLEKIASFLLLPFYAHIFRTQGYGVIGLVDTAVGVLTIAFAGGLHTAIVKTYYEEPPDRRPQVVSTAIVIVWIVALLIVPLPMLASKWIAAVLLGDPKYWILIVLALTTLVVDIGGKSAATYLVIQERSVLYSALSLTRMLLTIGLNVLLVIVLNFGLIGIFISSLTTASIATSVYVFVALRRHGLKFDKGIARRLCEFQLPLVPAEIISFISRQTERILVRFFISVSGAGILEMAYKFPPMLNMFFVAPFMLSWRTRSMEVGDQPDAPRTMGRMLTRFTFLLLLGSLLLAVNIRPVLVLLTPEEFWPAARIAQLNVVDVMLAGLVTYMQFGMLYQRRTKTLAHIKTVLACIKVAISVVLIQTFGLNGAAYSAVIIEAATLLWIGRASLSVYPIQVEYGRLAVLTAGALSILGAVEYVNGMTGGPLDALAAQVVPPVITLLQHSPAATWKSGKLLTFIMGHERAFAALILNTVACGGFVVLLPVAHGGALRMLSPFARRRVRAARTI